MMLHWDVNNGIATKKLGTKQRGNVHPEKRDGRTPGLKVTVPYIADDK